VGLAPGGTVECGICGGFFVLTAPHGAAGGGAMGGGCS
jgi:hypothetical protein